MPRIILHHAETDLYIEYSTVVDAPTTIAVTREQMRAYLVKRDGDGGDNGEAVDERLDHAKAHGSSERWTTNTLEEAIRCNHAGKDETEMSLAQFVKYFFVDRQGADGCEPPPVGEVKRGED